jgi:hypothetical protein
MLTVAEREAVIEAIGLFLQDHDDMRAAARALVGDAQFGLDLADPPVRSPVQWARAIVAYCEADAWSHLPPWLFYLLSNLPPRWPELRPVFERIKAEPPRWVGPAVSDPVDVLWLNRVGMPFLDRRVLRDHLRHMSPPVPPGSDADDTSPAVLVITGPDRSGRSYTVELLHHLARERRAAAMIIPRPQRPPEPAVAVVTIPPKMGSSMNPERLAEQFAKAMLADEVDAPVDIATPDRMSQYLSQWVLERAGDTRKEWWLVLDGLDDADLDDRTMGFVGKLAEQVVLRTGQPRVRLVLIGCRPPLVDALPAERVAREQLGEIGEVDLEPFFAQLLAAGGSPSPPPEAVKLAVMLVLDDLPSNGDRLPLLNRALREKAAQVCHA